MDVCIANCQHYIEIYEYLLITCILIFVIMIYMMEVSNKYPLRNIWQFIAAKL